MASDEPVRTTQEPALLRVIDRLSSGAGVISGLALVALILNVTVDVVARTFAGRPIGLTLELTQYWWMPLVVGLSYALAQQKGEHITVTVLLDRLPVSTRRIVEGVFSALGTVIVLLLAWFAFVSAADATELGLVVNSDPPLPYWHIKIVVAVGLALFALQLAATTIRHFIGTSVLVDELATEADAV